MRVLRNLVLASSFLTSLIGFSQNNDHLNNKRDRDPTEYVGAQEDNEPYNHTFEFERTSDTRNKAHVKVPFKYYGEYCVSYSSTRYGTSCNEYRWGIIHTSQTFILHFRHAKDLSNDETESYQLTFTQKDFNSNHLHISATAPEGYEIERSDGILRAHDGLKFKYND